MKKINKYILLFILFVPLLVNAKMTNYESSVISANSYIENSNFLDRNKYLLIKDNLYSDSVFRKGGFLSIEEYKLSTKNGKSYLSPGLEYWTLTTDEKDDNKKYCISNSIISKDMLEVSNVRVTEYVKKGTKVKGKGTYTNPWVFTKTYLVQVKSNNTKQGKINNEEGIERIVNEQDDLKFNINTEFGYGFKSSDGCNIKHIDGNEYKIEKINRDVICLVKFDNAIYTYNLDGNPTPTKIYLKYSKGWYKDENAQTTINKLTTIPTKPGYIFKGYYTESNGTGTEVIDSNGNILEGNTRLPNDSVIEKELYASWEACGPGTYSSENTCVQCPAGTYAPAGSSVCTACPTGYCSKAGAESCQACALKSYACANTNSGSVTDFHLQYTGNCQYINDGNDNWRIKFLTSGTATFSFAANIDVFLVGGGGGGGMGGSTYGGTGGGGGYTTTKTDLTLTANSGYTVTIGGGGKAAGPDESVSGGNGGTSSAFGYSAAGGQGGIGANSAVTGAAGGSGGGANAGGTGSKKYIAGKGGSNGNSGGNRTSGTTEGSGGGPGCSTNNGCKINDEICTNTYEFCELGSTAYAAGGGGGVCVANLDPASHVTNYENSKGGTGGSPGGGSGAKCQWAQGGSKTAGSGAANTGSGGGGIGNRKSTSSGAGGSGIVVIRNARD